MTKSHHLIIVSLFESQDDFMRNSALFPFVMVALLSACSSGQPGTPQAPSPAPSAVTATPATSASIKSVPTNLNTNGNPSESSASQPLSMSEASGIVKSASHGAMVAVRTFDTHLSGLTGVVVAPQAAINQAMSLTSGLSAPSTSESLGKVEAQIDWNKVPQQIVFIGNDAKVLIPQLFSQDGENINELMMVSEGVHKSNTQGLTEASNADTHSFLAGTKGPIMTVFMDPNCSWCNRLFKDLEPNIKSGKIRVRFVMVGFLKENSRAKSVAILSSKSPYGALSQDENNFNEAKEEGGISGSANPDVKLMEVVDSNTRMMNSIAQAGTPMILYCNSETGKPDIIKGYPQDFAGLMGRLSDKGHPACSK